MEPDKTEELLKVRRHDLASASLFLALPIILAYSTKQVLTIPGDNTGRQNARCSGALPYVGFTSDSVAKLLSRRLTNRDSVGLKRHHGEQRMMGGGKAAARADQHLSVVALARLTERAR
jgi:hypothetical protein